MASSKRFRSSSCWRERVDRESEELGREESGERGGSVTASIYLGFRPLR